MGDAMPPPPRRGGFDQYLMPDVIVQTKQQGLFKKPFQVLPFQMMQPARGVSPARSATPSMAPGITSATYQTMKLQLVESPDGQDRDCGVHQSRDQAKKSQSPLKRPVQELSRGRSWEPSNEQGRGCSASWHPSDQDAKKGCSRLKSKSQATSATKEKEVLKAKSKESGQARPSHEHWLALPMASAAEGMKWRPPPPSPLKKDEVKVARRLSMQQQAGQLQAT